MPVLKPGEELIAYETDHPRHDAVYVGWLEEKLAEKKVAEPAP